MYPMSHEPRLVRDRQAALVHEAHEAHLHRLAAGTRPGRVDLRQGLRGRLDRLAMAVRRAQPARHARPGTDATRA